MIEEDETFASHDVVSLFTNTPIDKALTVISQRLDSDKTLKKRTKLTVSDIMDLCEYILTATYFQFRDTIYRQKPSIPHCSLSLHGVPETERHRHIPIGLPANSVEKIRGLHLRKDKERTITEFD